MGVVYRAHDERLDRDVALKVLPAGSLADEDARGRFKKEALALSKLNHPNIATIHDFDSQAGVDFLVMEFIPGKGLDQVVLEGGLSEEEVRVLGAQLADGLVALHQYGMVHRDLKPGNLRLTQDGRLKILDFGLARLLQPVTNEPTATSAGATEFAGTLPYMAPEQIRGDATDARTDVYGRALVKTILDSGYMDHHIAYSLGAAYAQLGDLSEAKRWLGKAAETGLPCYPWHARDPLLNPLRSDPEFQRFLSGLQNSWRRLAAHYGAAAG